MKEEAEHHLRRWRMILGGGEADGTGISLAEELANMDRALSSLYDAEPNQKGGLGSSAPTVTRWLGDIRKYFPSPLVRIMQQDAFSRLGLQKMLLEPEMLATVEADVHLVAMLLSFNRVIPERTKETARQVVKKVVEELERKLADRLRQAVVGSLNRAVRNRRPRHQEIDWPRTIRANLKHYQQEYRTIIPEQRIGFGRKGTTLRDIILCVDQSGSMATSVVYSSIMAAVMASIRSVHTSLVVFDTSVVDLTDMLSDPVDVLFGTQLGGGTDISKALSYCGSLIQHPTETILILISDLYEGGDRTLLLKHTATLVASGVQVIALLSLSDEGTPQFDHGIAAQFAQLGIISFACTPDLFPDLMAAAIKKEDISQWAANEGMLAVRSEK